MSKAKKFGTFGGVFTPSVLTILGVIMYMRLGWVVGEAGLFSAIVIILISHIISVSTGLSISSIATDKKIKTGGIYYILSRSLGLPMGGAIGIALFVGTALSIALYLVGFAESFLSIQALQEFLHLEQNVNSYRIIGTAFLLILTIIAFISTSLAIKSQYFILGAIALSIVSIVVGFFINTQYAPESVIISPPKDGVPLITIFAIFFPAVTGFTAGVAMSGDLKDPKKAIPTGTLASISVGLVVYVLLAIGFAFFVNRDLLTNDYNFLLKVAWLAPLVVAGIWGATLSSALGGILGGPRILQAISQDKLTPRIFAKGYGDSNDPRNALILIFIIAEIGILIGELNVIAGVVSMFYLASYGFINLAFFLESWASTDFRPSFKINRFVGLIGFIASFGVMFQLDPITMFASLIIMFLIYLILSRKQLKSEGGDVWQSVGLSVVRFVLHKIDNRQVEQRNWQPNIVLFSGGTEKRPHLIEFGKSLVGRYGMLSNFDLHESKGKRYLFPKHLQSTPTDNIVSKGIFTRRQTCSDIYTGVETIVSTYGFSGIEPNTVLMGWARGSSNPNRFVNMLQRISELDTNIILIDYDERYGYGDYKTIDIWWRGEGNHGNLSLTLMKFLWASDDWNGAKLRLLIVNPVNNDASKIRNKAEQAIENLRISAEIRIINNQIEQKSFYDIIRIESLNSDLIILGIPEIEIEKEEEFVSETSRLMQDIGTVVLVKASSQFKALNFGVKQKTQDKEVSNALNLIIEETDENNKLSLPQNALVADNVTDLYKNLRKINETVIYKSVNKVFATYNELINNIEININDSLKNLNEIKNEKQSYKTKTIINSLDLFIKKTNALVKKYNDDAININSSYFKSGIEFYMTNSEKLLLNLPEYQFYTYTKENLSPQKEDDKITKKYKQNQRIKQKLKPGRVKYKVRFKKLISSYIPIKTHEILKEISEKFGMITIQYVLEIQKFIKIFRNNMLELQYLAEKEELNDKQIEKYRINIKTLYSNIKELEKKSSESVLVFFQNQTADLTNNISNDLKQIDVNRLIKRTKNKKKAVKQNYETLLSYPNKWLRAQNLLFNDWIFELQLLEFENKLLRILKYSSGKIIKIIEETSLKNITDISDYLKKYVGNIENSGAVNFKPNEILDKETLFLKLKKVLDIKLDKTKYLINEFPEKIELIANEAHNNLFEEQFDEIDTVNLSAQGLIDYIIQSEMHSPLIRLIETLPEAVLKTEDKALNVLRLISFSFFNSEGNVIDPKQNTNEKISSFINQQIEKLDNFKDEIKAQTTNISRQFDERMNSVSDKLSIYSLVGSAGDLKQYINKYSKTKTVSFIKQKYIKAKTFTANQINRLWYRHSEALILKQNIENSLKNKHTRVNDLLDLLDDVSVSSNVLKKLPFYYQQLFLRTHNYNNEFWFGRNVEIKSIEKAIERYKSGYYGAIMVTGDKFSGKTFFSKFAISKLMPDVKVYNINPPSGGSCKVPDFKTELGIAVKTSTKSYKRIFMNIERGSVMIIDDIELWWEKAEGGNEVIKEIISLIDTYSNKCLFIVNINIHAFEIINRIVDFENNFLNIIKLQPFNAEQLKEIILFRHNSGGLKFKLKKRLQENMRQAEYAKLFAKHFNYSQGNIGISLFSWVANILEIEKETLLIKMPSYPETSTLDNLETDSLIILIQFIIHKELTIEKLERVLLQNENVLLPKIAYLKRSGIIAEETPDVFEINRFLYAPIKRKLEEIEML